jgi:hypothetical protein
MPEAIIGGVFVLPTLTAPASRSFSATNESSFAIRYLNAGEPVSHVMPLYFMLALRVYGIPSSGPIVCPVRCLSSLAAASAKAFGFKMGIELRHGPLQSYVKILSRCLASSSTAVIDPVVKECCKSAILASTMLCFHVSNSSVNRYASMYHVL